MRYQLRARDSHGDFGVCVGTYWWKWHAQRRLAKQTAQLEAMRTKMKWTGHWEYYLREVP